MQAPQRPSPVPGQSGPVPAPKTLKDGSILAQLREVVVRAGGLEPPRPVMVCGFSYHFGFRRTANGGFVVWIIPSPFPV